jgi:DNA polymerase-3 subunit delta'
VTVWERLVGQDDTIAALQAAARAAAVVASGGEVEAGALTHAWLFTGPPGSGRSVAARAFAAALQCDHPENPGCGECAACHTVLGGTHPDVKLIATDLLSLGVEQMRELVRRAASRPVLGRWAVIIVEDADRLTERAGNALLKFVEEPPPQTIFMLCAPSTHPDDISVTIRSRCRHLTLRTPPAAAVEAVLREDGLDAQTAAWAAAAGQGHIGRSRRLARDAEAQDNRAAVLAIPASLTSLQKCLAAADLLITSAKAEADAVAAELDAGETEALQVALGAGGTGKGATGAARGSAGQLKALADRQKARRTRTNRDALDRSLVDLAAFYRDVLLAQNHADVTPAHPDFAEEVRVVAGKVSPSGVLQRMDAVIACRTSLDLNVKPQIAVEALMATLRLPA